jgi:hypothetical protein
MALGPFQPTDKVRIPLEVTLNGKAIPVAHARIQRLIMPDGADAPNFPQLMLELKPGTYMLELTLNTIGSYMVILQAEIGNDTIEQIETFIIERPFGFPRVEIARD